jgi:NAD(P)-dependent dehydrogenase (short-subunit alcohol dehydrogenase family)
MEGGKRGIRVGFLRLGHVVTSMVEKHFQEGPGLPELWEGENMLGRLARLEEFRGSLLGLLSHASRFMTGGTLVLDGGLLCLVDM